MTIQEYGPFRDVMAPLWEKSGALSGGTEEMRRQGRTYLPDFEKETPKNYDRRLNLACLTNFYVKAKNQMAGEIFRDEVQYKDGNLPDELIEDVDRRGSDLHNYSQKLAEALLTKAVCGILIDHPQNDGGIDAKEERELELRHYWSLIKPEHVIDIRAMFDAGKETITHVRWFEDHIVPGDDEFSFNTLSRIIVLDRQITMGENGRAMLGAPRGRIYQSDVEGGKNFEPIGEWRELVGFKEIPFIPLHANRHALFQGRPPLADIAEKNIQHWRHSSNYGNALEIGSFPVLVRYGLNAPGPIEIDDEDSLPTTDDGESIIGPHIIMDMPSKHEGAGAEYLEPSGRAYQALERGLDRIIGEAELMALDLLVKQLQKTATEANYDRLAAMAPLQLVAAEVERGVNRALMMTAEARGKNEKPGIIEINKDFGITTSDAIRVQALRDARMMGDITPATYLEELQRIGALSAHLNAEMEAEDAGANDDDLRA